MNDDGSSLRWRARIGQLRPVSVIIAILAFGVMLFLLIELPTSLKNDPDKPETATIADIIDGKIEAPHYVSVSGRALYDTGYQKTSDGKVTTEYYFLQDRENDVILLVEAPKPFDPTPPDANVTIVGMIGHTESSLRTQIESDLPDLKRAGVRTNADVFLNDGTKPLGLVFNLTLLCLFGGLGILGLVPLLFSPNAFLTTSIDQGALAAAPTERPNVKATGTFLKLNSVQPTLQVGKGTRKFTEGIANTIPLAAQQMLVYIHHIQTTKAYGATINKQETHWGIQLDASNVLSVSIGLKLGWRDRLAAQIEYNDHEQKPQALILSFDKPAEQAKFVKLMQTLGFAVHMN